MLKINKDTLDDSGSKLQSMDQNQEIESQVDESSPNLPVLSSVVKSPSMSLIDDSAKLLYDTMLEAGRKNEKTKDTIKEICQCAEQIHKLMRLKYDVIRTFEGS